MKPIFIAAPAGADELATAGGDADVEAAAGALVAAEVAAGVFELAAGVFLELEQPAAASAAITASAAMRFVATIDLPSLSATAIR
jgi:hypothetical protein